MKKMKKETVTKAEMIMMGAMQPVSSEQEVKDILDYIATTLKMSFTGEEVVKLATRYTKNAEFKYIHIGTMDDMIVIALPMTTDEDEEPFDIVSEYGAFSYVYNATYPDLSELGYCFFGRKNGRLTRLG